MLKTADREKDLPVREGYSGIHEKSGPFHSFLEHTATISFPAILLPTLYLAIVRLYELDLLWTIVLAVPGGWILSDFISGLIHWLCDTYGTEKTPIVGEAMIRPFRMHHIYPRDITTHNLVITIGNTCIVTVPALSIFLILMLRENPGPASSIASVTFAVTSFGTVMTNQFHKWAHLEEIGPWMKIFQKMGIILSPAHHDVHHVAPHLSHYCITHGWMDYFLEKIKFFRGLEAGLEFVGIQTTAKKLSVPFT